MPEYRNLRFTEIRPGIGLATLDRPEKLNALTFEMFGELRRLCADLDVETPLRALILTGAGRGFCAGLDLAEAATLPDMPTADMLRRQQGWADVAIALRELPIPVIAAVNGPASGAGFSIALAADIRIAAPSAQFNAAFVRVGLSGGDVGSSWLLPRIVGLGHAYELLLTGRPIAASEAHRLGIVNRVVSAERLLPEAVELAEEIAGNSPLGVRLTKQVVQANVDAPSLRAAIDLENRNQVLATRSEDMREALAAFRGKRAPEFTG
jgi:enoyl-CoA hydratase/carnithine racemase